MQLIEFIPLERMGDCAIIVTEFIVGMDLCNLREKYKNSITEKEAVNITRKVVHGIQEMHQL